MVFILTTTSIRLASLAFPCLGVSRDPLGRRGSRAQKVRRVIEVMFRMLHIPVKFYYSHNAWDAHTVTLLYI